MFDSKEIYSKGFFLLVGVVGTSLYLNGGQITANPNLSADARPPSNTINTAIIPNIIQSAKILPDSRNTIDAKVVDIDVGGESAQVLVTESGQLWLGPSYSVQNPVIFDPEPLEPVAAPITQAPADKDLEAERLRFLDFADKATSISIAHGENRVFVFFDADCTYCHSLFEELHTEGLAKELGLKVSWIPISIFKSDLSKLGATTLAKLTNTDVTKAVEAFADLMTGQDIVLDKGSLETHKSIIDHNTALFISGINGFAQGGTPLVVFQDKAGKVKFYPYKPGKEVFSTVGPQRALGPTAP